MASNSASNNNSDNNNNVHDAHQGRLSPFVCACFTLNYLIGTGFLTLPWAFEVSGIFLSCVTMAFTCVIANVASDYILSAMARADAKAVLEGSSLYSDSTEVADNEAKALLHDGSETNNTSYKSMNSKREAEQQQAVLAKALAVEFDESHPSKDAGDDDYYKHVKAHGKLLVGHRKFEMTELCQIFLGNTGLLAYGISASLDLYGFLWAYSSVFASAMSHLLPLGFSDDYPAWLAIFACIVTPLSLLHLSEQATIQVFLSGCRILMAILMIGTPLAAAEFGSGGDPDRTNNTIDPVPHFGEQTEAVGTVWVDFGNFHKMFPAIVFCLLFHQAVPGLADELSDKPQVGIIFGYTFALCGLLYSLLGIVGAWYFGDTIYQSANLNWNNYHGGTGQMWQDDDDDDMTTTWTGVALWARFIKIFVVSFPALDVVSTFPIYAYVLGNTLVGIFHANNIQEMQHNRKVLTFYRAIAALPPIAAALFLRDLGTITDYSGLVGLAIAFCFPPLLYISSEKDLKKTGAPYRTRYERLGTSSRAAMAMFWFGAISIVFCFILLLAF